MIRKIVLSVLIFGYLSIVQATTLDSVPVDEYKSELSLALVQKYNLGVKLTDISYQLAYQSPFYRMITNKVGEENAIRIINKEVDHLVPEYQERWNKYLASSISEVLSVEKMKSLLDNGASSEYFSEFNEKSETISLIMNSKSYDLLHDLMTKAMIAANDKMVK